MSILFSLKKIYGLQENEVPICHIGVPHTRYSTRVCHYLMLSFVKLYRFVFVSFMTTSDNKDVLL